MNFPVISSQINHGKLIQSYFSQPRGLAGLFKVIRVIRVIRVIQDYNLNNTSLSLINRGEINTLLVTLPNPLSTAGKLIHEYFSDTGLLLGGNRTI